MSNRFLHTNWVAKILGKTMLSVYASWYKKIGG